MEHKTYSQDWSAYNAAQTQEKIMFLKILEELVCFADVRQEQKVGRPSMSVSDMIYCMCLTKYNGKSARRVSSELKLAERFNYISKTPHFNTVLKYFKNNELTPLLHQLVTLSALPLKNFEEDFTVDASGFTTNELGEWRKKRFKTKVKEKQWVKMHVMSGVRTNIITSVEITGGSTSDTIMFKPLVHRTGVYFSMKEVSADKGYVSRSNFALSNDYGFLPFIPFKKNSKRWRAKKALNIWGKMYDMFHENADLFYEHYHKRSNAETVFAMLKRKFGSRIRTKSFESQTNEMLCVVICHNICVLIQEMFELGIKVDLNLCANEIFAH